MMRILARKAAANGISDAKYDIYTMAYFQALKNSPSLKSF